MNLPRILLITAICVFALFVSRDAWAPRVLGDLYQPDEPCRLLHTAARNAEIERCAAAIESGIHAGRVLGEIHFRTGYMLDVRGDWSAALPHYERARALYPERTSAHINVALIQGRELKDYEATVSAITQAIDQIDPVPGRYQHAWSIRAKAHFYLRHYDAALEDIETALSIDPDDVEMHYYAAIIHRRGPSGYDAALASINAVIERIGTEPGEFRKAWRIRATILAALGRDAEALQDVEKALALDRRDVAARLVRANIMNTHRDFDQAFSDIQRALWFQPWNTQARQAKEQLLSTLKRLARREPERVLDLAKKAIQRDPMDATLRSLKASGHFALGNYEAAIKELTFANVIAPFSPAVIHQRSITHKKAGNDLSALTDLAMIIALTNPDTVSQSEWLRQMTGSGASSQNRDDARKRKKDYYEHYLSALMQRIQYWQQSGDSFALEEDARTLRNAVVRSFETTDRSDVLRLLQVH